MSCTYFQISFILFRLLNMNKREKSAKLYLKPPSFLKCYVNLPRCLEANSSPHVPQETLCTQYIHSYSHLFNVLPIFFIFVYVLLSYLHLDTFI